MARDEREPERSSAAGGGRVGRNQRAQRHRDASPVRGQTTIDFTVGVTLFLLALTSVFLFIPGTIQPFTEGGQEEIITANRVADSLSEGLLGDPGQPHVLNGTCTRDFFNDLNSDYCRFEGSTLTERIGIKDRQRVNISMKSNVSADDSGDEILCWDEDDGPTPRFIEKDSSDCDSGETRMAIGPIPPNGSGNSVTAQRIVDVNGTDATLLVEMW